MTSQLSGYGLGLLWIGAMALGGLVMLRQRPLPTLPPSPRQAKNPPGQEEGDKEQNPHDKEVQAHYDAVLKVYQRRQVISLVCQFVGLGGAIAGLGLLAVGVIK